ncbi:hypothetical protein M758_7G176700 [Ceratodon purpureus]|uniref:Uncharacterized protein n=1 Tax=Ceratodon purpureus TaxID=3225 RepID=A0A8T0HG93_CERPU|nr:hypothetical protein KC19_7G179600 [Ceratodon purpureus]KAG0611922.1 hypothetical protein M758_7G176700 [Ceratodon purpureus]
MVSNAIFNIESRLKSCSGAVLYNDLTSAILTPPRRRVLRSINRSHAFCESMQINTFMLPNPVEGEVKTTFKVHKLLSQSAKFTAPQCCREPTLYMRKEDGCAHHWL